MYQLYACAPNTCVATKVWMPSLAVDPLCPSPFLPASFRLSAFLPFCLFRSPSLGMQHGGEPRPGPQMRSTRRPSEDLIATMLQCVRNQDCPRVCWTRASEEFHLLFFRSRNVPYQRLPKLSGLWGCVIRTFLRLDFFFLDFPGGGKSLPDDVNKSENSLTAPFL